jgi:nicotinamide riboside kinase
MLHFSHAVAITGAAATGKTQLWQGLASKRFTSPLSSDFESAPSDSSLMADCLCAGVFEARGMKTAWKQVRYL